jgi:hypothetical protein
MSSHNWPKNLVSLKVPTASLVEEFVRILNDARDEKPIQHFLVKNSVILRTLFPPSRSFWVFDRLKFGNQYVPDFLLCTQLSTGFNWSLIELESPLKMALNSRGRMSSALTEAVGQINDWRIWLRRNIAYAHEELGLKGINAESHSVIIIGRQTRLNPKHINQYAELSKNHLTIMTYDRLVDSAKSIAK